MTFPRMNSSEMKYKLYRYKTFTDQHRTKELNRLLFLVKRYVDGASFTGEHLRHRTGSNMVKARCTLFHVIPYAIHVEQTPTHVTRISLAVQYEPVNS